MLSLTIFPFLVTVLSIRAVAMSLECQFKDIEGICYGHDLKSKYFLLNDTFYNLNHGSFGTVPKPVFDAQCKFFLEQESFPDTWFRQSYYDYINSTRAALAQLIHADTDDVVLVENASSAVNSILRSLGFKQGDKILRLSTAYGMVINTLDWMVETLGIEVIVVDVVFPVKDHHQIISAVSAALTEHPDVKLCIFSHISSMPALIEPVQELTVLAKQKNALVMIDGAHAPGVIDIDVNDIGADFYLGNCHKWLYSPKGTAFLFVAKTQQTELSPEPTVISSSGDLSFVGRYKYTGTRDYTAFASIPAGLAFVDRLGGAQQVQNYCHHLAVEGGKILAHAWNTSLLVEIEICLSSFLFF
jgi:selenocysteine lyase/cysteine desulfurase